MIDKVYVINLDCRKDKWLAQQCAFLLTKVPPNHTDKYDQVPSRRRGGMCMQIV